MTGQLLLYLPVLHAGYERLLDRYSRTHDVLLLGRSFALHHRVVEKEIRALDPARAAAYVRAAHPGARVDVVERDDLAHMVDSTALVVPEDTLLREVLADAGLDVSAVLWEPVFLRWDREWSRAGRPPEFDGEVTVAEVHQRFMRRATALAGLSSDWWRQVGALVVAGDEVILESFNRHLPSDSSPYADGDPRNEYRRGVAPELSTALHAEASLIARAARSGIALTSADMYVSTFPCPNCARLIAESGVARCYFAGGYSMLAGDVVLRAAGVELVYVSTSGPSQPTRRNRGREV